MVGFGGPAATAVLDFKADTADAKRSISGLGGQLQNSLGPLAAAAVVAGAGAAIVKIGTSAIAAGDRLDKMSQRTGVAVETLSALEFAASQTGTDLETLEKGFFGLSRVLDDARDGLSTAALSFEKVGIDIRDLATLNPERQFVAVADALSQVADESARGAIAQELFGRAGRQLLPLINQGAEGIARYAKEARELGLVMTTEQATAAAEATDAIDKLQRSTDALTRTIALELVPAIVPLIDGLTSWARHMQAVREATVLANEGAEAAVRDGNWDALSRSIFLGNEELIDIGQSARDAAEALRETAIDEREAEWSSFARLMEEEVAPAVERVAGAVYTLGQIRLADRFAQEFADVAGVTLDIQQSLDLFRTGGRVDSTQGAAPVGPASIVEAIEVGNADRRLLIDDAERRGQQLQDQIDGLTAVDVELRETRQALVQAVEDGDTALANQLRENIGLLGQIRDGQEREGEATRATLTQVLIGGRTLGAERAIARALTQGGGATAREQQFLHGEILGLVSDPDVARRAAAGGIRVPDARLIRDTGVEELRLIARQLLALREEPTILRLDIGGRTFEDAVADAQRENADRGVR